MRTYQLRRYEITPGKMAEFTTWLNQTLIPVREHFGYRIEFQLVDSAKNEFVWCVSLEASEQEFLEIQEHYGSSKERATAFETFPNCIDQMHISFVEALDLPK